MTGSVLTRSPIDEELLERVRNTLASAAQDVTPARVAAALRGAGATLGDAAVLDITDVLRAEISGTGPLDPLLREPGVTDVLVNGPGHVWVDRGTGLEQTAVRFRDEHAVRRLAQRLAAAAGRRLDDAMPYADVRMPDGTRMHAVLPPIAPDGPLISFRVAAGRRFGLAELVECASVPEEAAPWLTALVRARLAFLVSGGAGSGKTTVLGALLGQADPRERIVLIEDSGELRPAHPHVVRLESRAPNVEGAGRVGLDELVRQALRMRPDRVVVGEVRGAEVVDLLAALNTGHDGGCGTLHANSADDVPARLEALGVAAGMARDAVHAQAAAALDLIIHLVREGSGRRRLSAVDMVRRSSAGWIDTARAFAVRDGRLYHGPGLPILADRLEQRGWSPA
ncbi:TadA family conjugal transfer-associated ATPase [Phytoactinopolyspora halotolerans]|uniref:TadA family conjugal transfer-associated ATPase n=1 Tax=Phytoactinopolyspora halotolerans TaxID=1981512 RepID=A0A6L9S1R0_9ACTN|nr:TadA family conjugal transfer-associated ATPase [Phytoactinopolyspora halotolerans]NED99135.1 TadA family conjugal transfer-associated ATPase [Phytoactinopolyspora halotolerans]